MAHILSEKWGERDEKEVLHFTLTNNNGVELSITNYGGTITGIKTPDRNNIFKNVTLAFNSLQGYLQPGNPCFGCLVGRFANRIAGGRFSLDGKEYTLAKNNNGNSLHGGIKGFDKVVWDATLVADRNALRLAYSSREGEEGFPGNLNVTVEYILSEDNAVTITYNATTDAPTPVNLTNHAYFNLSGGADDTILEHELQLSAETYTVSDDSLIPTGEIASVTNTPLDFRKSKKLGKDIADIAPGYDHNFVLNNITGALQHTGTLYHPASGRYMEAATTQPGVQLYTGNFLDGSLKDTPGGIKYNKHAGLCLETQHYPDSPNQPSFPDTILRPGQLFHHTTVYTFGVR